MSRIYEALKNKENSVAHMIENEQRSQPSTAAIVTAVAAEEEPAGSYKTAVPSCSGTTEAPRVKTAPSETVYRTVQLKARNGEPVLPFDSADQRTAEAYRILRTNILHDSAKPRTLVISSAGPGDGKTTTSINLAGVLALKHDARVLLIDADLRRQGIAPKLGIDKAPGLAEVLTGVCALDDAIVRIQNLPNLFVLPAGNLSLNPAELLDSAAWRGLIARARDQFQFTVVDTTPVGAVADFALVEKACDKLILVARPDHTDRKACLDALRSVSQEKLLGIVLNGTQEWFLWRSHDQYYRS